MNSTAAIKDFTEKWCLKVIECMKGDDYILHAPDECLTDLTALINEHTQEMFEFVKWVGFNSTILYYRDIDEKWIMSNFDDIGIITEEFTEYTTEELFNYWKENCQ